MFKFHKYVELSRRIPKFTIIRYRNTNSDNLCANSYICKKEQQLKDDTEKEEEEIHPFLKCHTPHNGRFWKRLFLFLCIPAIVTVYIKILFYGKKQKRPAFVEYSYLRIRRKPYPWDPVRTLFHNPRMNALPGIGYEVEVPEDEEEPNPNDWDD